MKAPPNMAVVPSLSLSMANPIVLKPTSVTVFFNSIICVPKFGLRKHMATGIYSGQKTLRRADFGVDVSAWTFGVDGATFRRGGFGVEVSAWRFRRGGFGAEVSARSFRHGR